MKNRNSLIKTAPLLLAATISGCYEEQSSKKSTAFLPEATEPEKRSLSKIKAAERVIFKDGTLASNSKEDIADANWQNKSTLVGTGVNAAIEMYGDGDTEIIVAVIDSGVEIDHPDLEGQLWENPLEILDGIDNDGNGYIDDIHGWSYLGENQQYANFEITRLYRDANLQSIGIEELAPDSLEYKIKSDYEALTLEYQGTQDNYLAYYLNLEFNPQTENDPFDATLPLRDTPRIYHPYRFGFLYQTHNYLHSQHEHYSNHWNHRYGNNSYEGIDARHGTHIAGTIAAIRGNGSIDENLVTDGVSANARIMALRVVPDGDEHDIDLNHAIRYAVNNGARIINMSFGKAYSQYPDLVIDAFEYAALNNVLMVHAAGNEGVDIADNTVYPRRFMMSQNVKDSWIEVASTTKFWNAYALVSAFSNFGGQEEKAGVDLFSPGSAIVSTTPNGSVDSFSGTSMAAPHVSGISALLLSHSSELSPLDVKNLLMSTVDTLNANVYVPTIGYSPYSSLTISGGKVSAIGAFDKLYEVD